MPPWSIRPVIRNKGAGTTIGQILPKLPESDLSDARVVRICGESSRQVPQGPIRPLRHSELLRRHRGPLHPGCDLGKGRIAARGGVVPEGGEADGVAEGGAGGAEVLGALEL